MDFNLYGIERLALIRALENYLNGIGMPQVDEDESVLETILSRLEAEN